MAQLNITLNQDEILQLLLEDKNEAFRMLLQDSLNSLLKAESAEQLGAERYQRSDDRTDSRNGSRERTLKTRIGTIELSVPRHRNVPFHSLIFDNYSRSEAALVSAMAEMVVNGVSTRKVSKVMETLCGTSFSKSTVSEVCKELDGAVQKFKVRPLAGKYPFMYVDATYFRVRGERRVEARALMIAFAYTEDGRREILGFEVYENESKETWKLFIESLKERGLDGLKMVTSDAHPGIIYALSKTYPTVPWQRCQTHFSRNILESVPKKYQKAIGAALSDMYNSATIEEARNKRDSIIDEYQEVASKATECLDKGFEDAMTVMVLPKSYRRFMRTSNHIERLNRELKRRSKAIGVFPNEESLIRIIGTVLMERNDVFLVEQKLAIPKTDIKKLEDCTNQLTIIALNQQKLLAA